MRIDCSGAAEFAILSPLPYINVYLDRRRSDETKVVKCRKISQIALDSLRQNCYNPQTWSKRRQLFSLSTMETVVTAQKPLATVKIDTIDRFLFSAIFRRRLCAGQRLIVGLDTLALA